MYRFHQCTTNYNLQGGLIQKCLPILLLQKPVKTVWGDGKHCLTTLNGKQFNLNQLILIDLSFWRRHQPFDERYIPLHTCSSLKSSSDSMQEPSTEWMIVSTNSFVLIKRFVLTKEKKNSSPFVLKRHTAMTSIRISWNSVEIEFSIDFTLVPNYTQYSNFFMAAH